MYQISVPPPPVVTVLVVVVVIVVELKQPTHGTPMNIGVRIIPAVKLPIWACWFIVAERETLGLNAPATVAVGLNVGLTLTPVLKVPGWTVCTIEPLREMDGLLVIAAVCAKDSERLIEGLKLSVVVIAPPATSNPMLTSLKEVEAVVQGVVSEVPRLVMCSEQSRVTIVGAVDWSCV